VIGHFGTLAAMPRAATLLALVLSPALLLLGCDKSAEKKADDKKVADKGDDNKGDDKTPEPADKPKKLEHPWEKSGVQAGMKLGTTLVYKQTGKDAAGKDVEDDFQCQIKAASADGAGVVCNGINHPSKDKGANEVATTPWTDFSPFWAVEQPTSKLISRGDITVPAGTFDTVEIEVKGFFGDDYTFWLIADKPGVYAKVIKRANTTTEGDQTNLTFELAKLE
jgi:hypothetical protein